MNTNVPLQFLSLDVVVAAAGPQPADEPAQTQQAIATAQVILRMVAALSLQQVILLAMCV